MPSDSSHAQLPSAPKLSAEDERGFDQELQRLCALLSTASDKCAVQLQIADTYAAGGQYPEAMRRLRSVVDAKLGFDPYRDSKFQTLRHTLELQSLMEQARRQTPPVLNARPIATFDKPEFVSRKPRF